MNLLTDRWIPIADKNSDIKHISLAELLSDDGSLEVVCHRDDMELAVLQLSISLVQNIFKLANEEELKARIKTPVNVKEYQKLIKPYLHWFDLKDLQFPCLQNRLNSKDIVPIQKLFNGLPEGNNHTWHYNCASRIDRVCSSCAVIMLFNQATATPSFGGGFKNPLRGASPITTLVKGKTLRETIWLNVLSQEFISKYYPSSTIDVPNWVLKMEKEQEVEGGKIGLLRGLFWQPALVELVWGQSQRLPTGANCDSCGVGAKDSDLVIGFKRQKFAYKLTSDFLHPHSPRVSINKKGEQSTFYSSFNENRPSWTQLSNFVFEQKQKDTQTIPALVVEQYQAIFPNQKLNLVVGGYINNQSKITARRHETFSLTEKLNSEEVKQALSIGVEIGSLVRGKAYGLGLAANLDKLPSGSLGNILNDLQSTYYSKSENVIYSLISGINNFDSETDKEKQITEFTSKLTKIADEMLVDFANSYPTMNNQLNGSRKALGAAISKLTSPKKEISNV